jgi:putative membrane protein
MNARRWLITLTVLAGLIGAQPATAQQPGMGERGPAQTEQGYPADRRDWHWRMMEEGWHDGFGYGHWGFSLLFWTVVIIVVVLAVRGLSSAGGGAGRRKSALELLEERYARGEIDREEYLQRRKDLESSGG